MQKDSQSAVLAACRYLIKPLVRLLLHYGIGYREFSDVCKSAFVEVASSEYGLRGRPANLSRVSVLTGLSRKEVRKLRTKDRSSSEFFAAHGLNAASMVLRGWYSDPQFLSANGTPIPLSPNGRPPNLSSLVKRYAGDLPVGAVIGEMKRVGVVEEMESGGIRPVGSKFMPPNVDGQLFASGATSIHNLISTIRHNVSVASEGGKNKYFERYAWSNYLPERAISQFQDLVTVKGSDFLEVLNAWLKKHEKGGGPSGKLKQKSEVGVGVYFFNTLRE